MTIVIINNDLDIFKYKNVARDISKETAAEIRRVEDYLNSLRQLQVAIDPHLKKRKYTKLKKAGVPNIAQFVEEIRPEVLFIPNRGEYTTNYEITGIKNNKKSRSRKKVV